MACRCLACLEDVFAVWRPLSCAAGCREEASLPAAHGLRVSRVPVLLRDHLQCSRAGGGFHPRQLCPPRLAPPPPVLVGTIWLGAPRGRRPPRPPRASVRVARAAQGPLPPLHR